MLEKLVEAEECTVTLCCDGLSDNEAGLGLFSPVKKRRRIYGALQASRAWRSPRRM
ncbi:MAG: hypothetical protein ACLRZH_04320 [Ruthenibacterium lactatiformans]